MLDIVGLISLIVLLVIILITSYTSIVFGMKNKKLAADVVQLSLDKVALLAKLEKEVEANQSKTLEQTDGFVKFLSESRDWAFEYIEKVQASIESLKVAVQNGSEIEEELAQLFSHLPDNKENKNG